MATWTEKIALLNETHPDSVAPFKGMSDEAVEAHPFVALLKSLWEEYTKAAKKTAVKKVLTEEEKETFRRKAQTDFMSKLPYKTALSAEKQFKEDFAWMDEDQLKYTKNKAIILGLGMMREELEKLGKTAPKATKTLADGRKVANHNNYARTEDELEKNEDGSIKTVSVKFKNGSEEVCGIIPTPGDARMTKGYTFKELDGIKSVERAQKGHSQVFIKKMWFGKDPCWTEGRCGCSAGLNKKIQLHSMKETVNEDGSISYAPAPFDEYPIFACNNPVASNGMCKAHSKMEGVEKWDKKMLLGWTPILETL